MDSRDRNHIQPVIATPPHIMFIEDYQVVIHFAAEDKNNALNKIEDILYNSPKADSCEEKHDFE